MSDLDLLLEAHVALAKRGTVARRVYVSPRMRASILRELDWHDWGSRRPCRILTPVGHLELCTLISAGSCFAWSNCAPVSSRRAIRTG